MSSHPLLSNALHARAQRARLETRQATVISAKSDDALIAPVLSQQALAAAVAPTACGMVPPRKHYNGHHHVHHNNISDAYSIAVIGGLDTNLLESVQKIFARRMAH
ncbi:hypothetical protein PFISCL1PPCAC_25403 [Pristionchus fissidentatus]|uniref:Uncharacterized protein n=1 Tax=Pristionchus fissidentatus TaxID=1538716 RepID=A0AAV5WQ40_9BILA|nr:hypothetical protein PFISCL1PPCAC_25403 [Pristionchus fissidentatus]